MFPKCPYCQNEDRSMLEKLRTLQSVYPQCFEYLCGVCSKKFISEVDKDAK